MGMYIEKRFIVRITNNEKENFGIRYFYPYYGPACYNNFNGNFYVSKVKEATLFASTELALNTIKAYKLMYPLINKEGFKFEVGSLGFTPIEDDK